MVLVLFSGRIVRYGLAVSILVFPLEKDLAIIIMARNAVRTHIQSHGIFEEFDRDRRYSFHIVPNGIRC
jgi:hypothetical protein